MGPRRGRDPGQLLLLLVVMLLLTLARAAAGGFQLTVLHTNDVHAHYEQTNALSGKCAASEAAQGQCFGGSARLYTMVHQLRQTWNGTVLVDAGDQYQGTIWFSKHGGNLTAHVVNMLGYDVMALGNHEFDRGVEGLRPLLRQATFPIISSNINASMYPDVERAVQPYVVLNVSGHSVAFVGYTSVETPTISTPDKVRFEDEVTSVTSQVRRLQAEGVNKIVCLGHSGYVTDLRIAEIPGVDVVVGGHSNTFLYNGTGPSDEVPEGDYPTVVTRTDGTRALVVQDYAYGKYLGFLQVVFDDNGEVTSWSGNPILLNSSIPEDPGMLADLATWKQEVDSLVYSVVGSSLVLLEGEASICRLRECNMGSVMADAMIAQNLRLSEGGGWNHLAIAILNGGSIRSSIQKGDITVEEVLQVQPFGNNMDIIEINGTGLLEVLEHSATQWDPVNRRGGFLQHSGLRVTYDMSLPQGQRVKGVKVRCADCPVPLYVDLEASKVYKVVAPSFLIAGGDGFAAIVRNTLRRHIIGDLDSDVLLNYIAKFSPITTGLENRITFLDSSSTPDNKTDLVNCPVSRASAILSWPAGICYVILVCCVLRLWGV